MKQADGIESLSFRFKAEEQNQSAGNEKRRYQHSGSELSGPLPCPVHVLANHFQGCFG
jgi:hypothetical protein